MNREKWELVEIIDEVRRIFIYIESNNLKIKVHFTNIMWGYIIFFLFSVEMIFFSLSLVKKYSTV